MASKEHRQISFRKLALRSLPEMGSYQILAAFVFSVPITLINRLMSDLLASYGTSITSANLLTLIKSWQAPVLLSLLIMLIFAVFILEAISPVFLCRDILLGKKVSVLRILKESMEALPRFMNARGLLKMLFILILVPLCGVGVTLSLTEKFYVPNFIMEVIKANPGYIWPYRILMLLCTAVVTGTMFSFHAILLDGQTPAEADRTSFRLVREHRKKIFRSIVLLALLIGLLAAVYLTVTRAVPYAVFKVLDHTVPRNSDLDIGSLRELDELSKEDISFLSYRFLCALIISIVLLLNTYLPSLVHLFIQLKSLSAYMEFTKGRQETYPDRPDARLALLGALPKLLGLGVAVAVALIYTVPFGPYAGPEVTGVIAHRTGGTMAFENSVEGLELAIQHGCYGSETDIQRTKDGYYIINHDSTFSRLAGVNRKPEEMTLEEIKEIRQKDSSGREYPVPTLEELLDVVKGRGKLLIELKGATADRQMVDDVVAIVREKGCTDSVALISLDYGVIDYAETNYPEFETGTLFFLGLGDVSNLNCDFVMMEEEAATKNRIHRIHEAGKKAVIWTVNTENGLYHFLSGPADAVITDEVVLAEKVQAELDRRSIYDELYDEITGN